MRAIVARMYDMLHDLSLVFLGVVLCYFGVIAGAIAERIRGAGRVSRAAKPAALMRSERAAEWTGVVVDEGSLRAPAAVRKKRPAPERELATVPMLNDVRDALVGLGFSKPIAQEAAADARRNLGDGAPLELWIREALRCCPKPNAVTA
jgi:hypothetical protein